MAAHLHDNPGAALLVRERATPRISHSVFARNGGATQSPGPFFIAPDAAPYPLILAPVLADQPGLRFNT